MTRFKRLVLRYLIVPILAKDVAEYYKPYVTYVPERDEFEVLGRGTDGQAYRLHLSRKVAAKLVW